MDLRMHLNLHTFKKKDDLHRTPKARSTWWWSFLTIFSTSIISYNCLTTLLANLAYLPPSLYGVYDCMTLEGAGAQTLYLLFVGHPPYLFLATAHSLLWGGIIGTLYGLLLTTIKSTTPRALFPGAYLGSLIGMALCTTILSLPERLTLNTIARLFFDLYALGHIRTIQIGCQYGAYPLALLHLHYALGLLLLIPLTITSTALLDIRQNQSSKHLEPPKIPLPRQ